MKIPIITSTKVRPPEDTLNLVWEMSQLNAQLKALRRQSNLACRNCKHARKATPEFLEGRREFLHPEVIGDRMVCLKSISDDPAVGAYADGAFRGTVLTLPTYCCVLYESIART